MTSTGEIRIAAAAELQSFVGAELTGVSVWKYGVALAFNDEPRSITVENGAEFRSQGRTEVYNQEIIVAFGARILSVMGRHVAKLTAADDKALVIEFDEGSVLTLRPDSSGYECYSVHLPDGSIFVGIAS
jgi:hypothetical protein